MGQPLGQATSSLRSRRDGVRRRSDQRLGGSPAVHEDPPQGSRSARHLARRHRSTRRAPRGLMGRTRGRWIPDASSRGSSSARSASERRSRLMPWWDRVRAMRVESIPVDPLPGRYLVASGSHVVVNGVPTEPETISRPSPTASGRRRRAGEKLHGEFREVELLRPLEASSLIGILERLNTPSEIHGITWSRLVHESPLVHPAPEHLEPTRIDREIKRHGPHLLEVSRKPHSVLDAVVEPTLAARAESGIPPRAVQYLAGHSEDWHRRTVTSVIPRRSGPARR